MNPLMDNAFELLARASSTSEVLTLNLTNLLILLVLKALIFGFGIFSFGGNRRSFEGGDSEVTVSKSDLNGGMCFLMYTSGLQEKLSCIQRSACEDPKTAKQYLTAAKMWHKMHSLIGVPFEPVYEDVMVGLQEASEVSLRGGACEQFNW